MPYQRRGSRVYVHKNGKWVLLKAHESNRKAEAHLTALNINVTHKK